MSTYPCRPKAEAFINAVDVVVHLHDPSRSSTEHTTPPSLAHVQPNDVPRTPVQPSVEGEFRQHDGVVTMLMLYRRSASPKHYDAMTRGVNCGGGTTHG